MLGKAELRNFGQKHPIMVFPPNIYSIDASKRTLSIIEQSPGQHFLPALQLGLVFDLHLLIQIQHFWAMCVLPKLFDGNTVVPDKSRCKLVPRGSGGRKGREEKGVSNISHVIIWLNCHRTSQPYVSSPHIYILDIAWMNNKEW